MRSVAGLFLYTPLLLLAALPARAHEIRPAYLEIREEADRTIHVLWKQPTVGDRRLAIRPVLSSGWLDEDSASVTRGEAHIILRWTIRPPHTPLAGQRLMIEGLDRTMTDALVRVVQANGVEVTRLVKPDWPELTIPSSDKPSIPVADYIQLGVVHIWTGVDHLLYVLSLLLLLKRRAALLKTITAFTAAHSITLAAASLGFVTVPQAPVEALIALSIVYVAVELVYLRRGRAGLTARFPWLVAFAFGLLHGLGFAGALGEVGLPPQDIPLALLCFNAGIEIGQLVFVVLVLTAIRALVTVAPRAIELALRSAPHVIGSVAAFWFIERTLSVI
jgi:hydrogenase/urease accessory protein HupE